jgi:hypothetical protein
LRIRCAVDGCRPLCSLIAFSVTGSWCDAEQVEQAEGALEHLDRDGALLAPLHAGSFMAEFSPDRPVAARAAATPLRTAPSSVAG